MKKCLSILTGVLAFAPAASASGFGGSDGDITSLMARLVLQLGIIVMIARLIGRLSQSVKLPFPSVLIEIVAGIAIGPYMLGSVPIPGFPDGIFPLASASGIPVTPELYGIATIASIIMLFSAGLETDLTLLLKFSLVGVLVGFGGVILPFAAAAASTSAFFGLPISDPAVLFLGVVCMATSVGVTARVISEQRKMDSPEAVTILAAAVIDDVLSIIALTIVISFIAAEAPGVIEGSTSVHAAWAISKAVMVWLGFTAAGILFAGPLSKAIKSFKYVANISIAALGLAFILAGIFQMAGLAMVIGAYVVGLSLSKTDLTDTVRDTLGVLHSFFVPVFFIVMGMLVDPRAFMSKEVLAFGAIYTSAALLTNIVGGALPALFLNFNRLGALRIGVGMIPRGEVALIIAGIGLSSGIIEQKFFGACMLMVIGSIFVAPPLISILFKSDRLGTKKEFRSKHTVATPIDFPSRKLTVILEQQLIQTFRSEGFFVHSIPMGGSRNIYHLRKNNIHIALNTGDNGLVFESDAQDIVLIKTVAYEALLQINDVITSVKDLIKPENMLKDLATDTSVIIVENRGDNAAPPDDNAAANNGDGAAQSGKDNRENDTAVTTKRKMDTGEFKHALTQGSIIPTLTGKTKREVIEKLVGILQSEGIIKNASDAVNAVMEREASMSTGMQNGIALPHARTDAVDRITAAVGLSKKGVDYQAFDGEPSKIFVLILSPLSTDSPHIQFLANIATMLNSEEAREKLLGCVTQAEIYNFFRDGLGS